jgi:hypothetical protein
MKSFFYGLKLFGLIALVAACSSKGKNLSTDTYLSSFIKKNDKVVAFGKVNLMSILNKADYLNIPKLGAILKTEKERLSHSIKLETPVYMAMEGPFDKNGNPAALYAFVEVINLDSLEDRLGSSGLFVEKSGDLRYAIDGDVSIGFLDNVAIVISKKEKYDGKATLLSIYESLSEDRMGGKVDRILASTSDIVAGISIERLYGTSNTELSKLEASKQKEIQNMVNDSYLESNIDFLNGSLKLETKNHFSTSLSNRMFFDETENPTIISKLGKGKARFGVSTNLNIPKMESFMDDFMQDIKRKILSSNSQLQMASFTMGDKPFSSLFSGVMGAVLVGDLLKDGSITPEVNFHVGLGDKGNVVADLAQSFFTFGGIKKSANGMVSYEGMDFIITKDEITGNTKNAGAGISSLQIPSVGKDFGKKGIAGFLNLEGLNMQSFGFRGGSKMLELVKNASFEVTNKGAVIQIYTTNQNQNILKQIVELYYKDIEKQVSGLTL